MRGRLNVVISGGTGTGKTTLLNALAAYIDPAERIVTSRTPPSCGSRSRMWRGSRAGRPNIEGRGEVTVRALVRNALRMRPDRIVVGEVRGGEALDMLQAMNTGHDGSLTTVHASSPEDALRRIETMALMAGARPAARRDPRAARSRRSTSSSMSPGSGTGIAPSAMWRDGAARHASCGRSTPGCSTS